MRIIFLLLSVGILYFACKNDEPYHYKSTGGAAIADTGKVNVNVYVSAPVQTGKTTPQELVQYAETLLGVPYKYASDNPAKGFDCSGFITYVFNHFGIIVPRSSVSFTHIPHEINMTDAKPADLILFTGTDSTTNEVGHMGIITGSDSVISFIHSSSGNANGVTITEMNDYYSSRFVKVIRVFPQND